jgi:hypothetical protein
LRSDVEPTTEPVEVELPEGRPRTTLDLAAAKLRTALQQRSGYVVVTAETSERAEALFSAVEPRLRTFRTIRVNGQALDPEAIVRALWRDGDVPFPARLAMRALIDEARAAAEPIVVVITDADTADPTRLERVRLTLEGAPDASEIVHIALLGGPALVELLRRPDARAVTMRIGATVQVPSVTADLATAVRTPIQQPRRMATLGIAALGTMTAIGAWLAWRAPAPAPPSPAPVASVAARPDVTPPPAPAAAAPVESPAPQAHEAAADGQVTPASEPPVAAPVPPPSKDEAPAIVPAPAVAAPAAAPPRAGVGALQVAAFVRAASADALRARLAPQFPSVVVSAATRDGTTYYRVRIAGFASAHDLDAAARALRASGYTSVRVRD